MESSAFLKSGINLAIFSLLGNIPVAIDWLIISVTTSLISVFISFNTFIDKPSFPQLDFGCKLSIMLIVLLSSIGLY